MQFLNATILKGIRSSRLLDVTSTTPIQSQQVITQDPRSPCRSQPTILQNSSILKLTSSPQSSEPALLTTLAEVIGLLKLRVRIVVNLGPRSIPPSPYPGHSSPSTSGTTADLVTIASAMAALVTSAGKESVKVGIIGPGFRKLAYASGTAVVLGGSRT